MERVDVVVVGLGVMGCATARALAQRGRSVVAFEQFDVGHKRGSSHGTSRIFRLSYPDATYVTMAQEALPLWRQLERECNEDLLMTTGGIDRGKPLDDHVAALSEAGARFELIDGREVANRWGFLSVPADEPALFQPDAGIVAAEKAVMAFAVGARAAGAEIVQGIRVRELTQKGSEVELGGERPLRARAVVITAGSWAPFLLDGCGIALDVRPTRETVGYFHCDFVPPSIVEWGDPSIYALHSPGHGVKVGEHIAGPTTDPDDEGTPNEASLEKLAQWVRDRLPSAESKWHHAETCLYTNTPDEHFVLERDDRIVVGSPCSGHGFKFAPLIGKRLADLAEQVLD